LDTGLLADLSHGITRISNPPAWERGYPSYTANPPGGSHFLRCGAGRAGTWRSAPWPCSFEVDTMYAQRLRKCPQVAATHVATRQTRYANRIIKTMKKHTVVNVKSVKHWPSLVRSASASGGAHTYGWWSAGGARSHPHP
jgi:hypothetical protein